jgi:hypothetical protein
MALYLRHSTYHSTYHSSTALPTLTKCADNIVKCFAAALAIVSGTLISVPLFNFHPSRLFAVGGLCTVSATVLYSWAPTQWPEGWTRAGRQQQRRRAAASLELEALDAQERRHMQTACTQHVDVHCARTACACACAAACTTHIHRIPTA